LRSREHVPAEKESGSLGRTCWLPRAPLQPHARTRGKAAEKKHSQIPATLRYLNEAIANLSNARLAVVPATPEIGKATQAH
jgi:hypothetical protein